MTSVSIDYKEDKIKSPDFLYPISSETKCRLGTLAPEEDVATLEEATTIIQSLLKDINLREKPRTVIFHVLYLHLRFLTLKPEPEDSLTEAFREYQNTSIQEICASLYKVVAKFMKLKRRFKAAAQFMRLKRKFERVWDFLKLRNINRLIKENTQYGRIQDKSSPPTLRRGPIRKSRYFSYA